MPRAVFPYRAPERTATTAGPLERLARLGADTDLLAEVEAVWAAWGDDERADWRRRIDVTTDPELAALANTGTLADTYVDADDLPTTVAEVRSWLSDPPHEAVGRARAQAVWDAELRRDRVRTTVQAAVAAHLDGVAYPWD